MNYRAYDSLEQTVNITAVDSRFDLGNPEDDLTSQSYLSKVIMQEPSNLFNYSNVGYQTYFNAQEEIELLDNLFFDSSRNLHCYLTTPKYCYFGLGFFLFARRY